MKNDIAPVIKKLGVEKQYAKGEMPFFPGSESVGFFFVLSGEIRVYKIDLRGKESEVVRLKEGDYFGEAVVFARAAFPFFSQAVKDSRLLFIPKPSVIRAVREDPAIAQFFLSLLAEKCLTLTQRLETMTLHSVRKRIIRHLLTHCSGERVCTVRLTTTKSDLAKILGTISETLSRNLQQLQKEGLIEVKGKTIRIKNCPKMRQELFS